MSTKIIQLRVSEDILPQYEVAFERKRKEIPGLSHNQFINLILKEKLEATA